MFELWVFFEDKWLPVQDFGQGDTDPVPYVYANFPSAFKAAKEWSLDFPGVLYRILDVDWDETYTYRDGKQLTGNQVAGLFEPVESNSDRWEAQERSNAELLADWERELLGLGPNSVTLSNGQTYSLSDFDRKAGSF